MEWRDGGKGVTIFCRGTCFGLPDLQARVQSASYRTRKLLGVTFYDIIAVGGFSGNSAGWRFARK